MTYDHVVIGAGISGITSALILARNGKSVALVEKAEQIAPVLRGFSRRGVFFDTGFHYTGGLGYGEPLDIFFRYLGVADQIESFPFREDGYDIFRSIREGYEFRLPCGYDLLRAKLSAEFPRDAVAIERYLRLVKDTCDSMPYLNLEVDIASINALEGIYGPTLKETLDVLTDNKLLKGILSMHCLLYGVAPDEMPFSQHARIVGGYYQSARGIKGGGLGLVKALETRLGASGVDVFRGSEVTELTVTSDGVLSGVRLKNGTDLACQECIATVHPHVLLDLVPDHLFRPAYKLRLRNLEETISAFILYAVSEVPIPILSGANLFLFPDAESIHDLGRRPVHDTPLYLTAAYRNGGSDPLGFIGISPARHGQTRGWENSVTGRRPDDYRLFKKDVVTAIQHHIETCCPELKGAMQHLEGSTPLTVRDFANTPHGGLYGIKHMVGQYNPQPVTKMKGLYLAGQAVVSPGVLGAVLSGFIACGSIMGHDRLRKELRACS